MRETLMEGTCERYLDPSLFLMKRPMPFTLILAGERDSVRAARVCMSGARLSLARGSQCPYIHTHKYLPPFTTVPLRDMSVISNDCT